MGSGRKSNQSKDDVSEDYCFVCKDGGDVRVCDYKNCLKSYHPHCVGKDLDYLDSDEQFICDWHTCFICKRSSYYQCFCCPSYSVCRRCIGQAEFVQVMRPTKGFCNNCLKLAVMIEKNVDVDSDEEKVDFTDTETYECLFKDYWEIIKDQEGLTLHNLQEASALLKKGQNCKQGSGLEKHPDEEHNSDEDFVGDNDDDDDDYDDELVFISSSKGKSNKVKTPFKKSKSSKKVYVGWGSKELIGFLASIGKDISQSLDQFSASEVVKEYIQQKNLFHQGKKKKHVICDDNLRSLFRKRKMKYNKIHNLLETHIAANAVSEDESISCSEDEDYSIAKKKARTMRFEAKVPNRSSEKNKNCFASLVGDNIKLIYLKRSLILDLLKNLDTFEHKVVGCFVRAKNDSKLCSYQTTRKPYQLGQVTGIKKSLEEYKIRDTSTNILLCVSGIFMEVKVSILSDDDFEEEECEDLRLLAKKESFKRPTVAEIEEKVKTVHRDIVSHWIDRELVRLDRLIEMSNEKGWRKEMHEYIDKRELLRKPAERQRLLEEVPQVIPDTEEEMKDNEVEVAADKSFQVNRGQIAAACPSVAQERLKVGGNHCDPCAVTTRSRAACFRSCMEENSKGTTEQVVASFKVVNREAPQGASEQDGAVIEVASEGAPQAGKSDSNGDTPALDNQKQNAEAGGTTQAIDIDEDDHKPMHARGALIIDLDDEDGGHMEQHKTKPTIYSAQKTIYGVIPEHLHMWHYVDPQGDEQGPFPMALLRRWKQSGFFDENFKVWRTDQTREQAILLTDAMRLTS